jgi:pyruvate kinase
MATVPPAAIPAADLEALRTHILALIGAVEKERARRQEAIDAVLARHRDSAANLAHYIGLRKRDLHHLQLELASLALSSLGRCEGHVLDTLQRLAAWLGAPVPTPVTLGWRQAETLLHDNARALFGPKPPDRHVYIMVTAPDASTVTTAWTDEVLRAGTDVLRINGAHESPGDWTGIVRVFRERAAAHGRPLRVFVDLPGPKLRGDIVRRDPTVLHFPRIKDSHGRTVEPISVALVPRFDGGAQIPVPPRWLESLQSGDTIRFKDAGCRARELRIRGVTPGGIRAECLQSLYVTAGLRLGWYRRGKLRGRGSVGPLPAQPGDLLLSTGDVVLLNADGHCTDPNANVLACPEPAVLQKVRTGDRVIMDDGKLEAVVESVGPDGLHCRILRSLKTPTRLRTGKGIAFPDSDLSRDAVGPHDETALAFALEHADGIEASFVNDARDVRLLTERLRAAARPHFGLVLKLETRQAMRNLPDILFEALRYHPVGLMIARGDLAVEMSFERLAEMQEEVLWFGEACHLPVVWATQVLDTLAHTGVPTRAEVTDAAMSMRAECVMLNKGPHLAASVRMLANIIGRMEAHQYKKRALYRPLQMALDLPPLRSPPAD